MKVGTKDVFETRPIECWSLMKELRRKRFRETWQARERGDLAVIGAVEWFLSLIAGLGDYANPSYGPYTTGVMKSYKETVRVLEEVDKQGYGHDICAPMRLNLGQLLLGMVERAPDGKPFKPDFVFQPNLCFNMPKLGQIFSRHLEIPFFILDVPHFDTEENRDYLFFQMQEAIEWMAKVTGREYNDAWLIESLRYEWNSMVLWSKICVLNQAVPAPLTFRQLWSLRLPLRTTRHKKETFEYIQILHDEVEERIKEGISGVGVEKTRLLQEGLPPFYAHELFKLVEHYGATYVGGEIPFVTFGAWSRKDDGTWEPPPTFEERGKPVETRDEALWALVDLYLTYSPAIQWPGFDTRVKDYIKRAADWQAQGVVFNLDPSCRVSSAGSEEAILALRESGVPVCSYECEESDPRTFDREGITRKIQLFLEEVLDLDRLDG